jgi:hypothetical protein
MLRRCLDVAAQYAKWLAAIAILVPSLLAIETVALDRPQVTARIWAGGNTFLLRPGYDTAQTPAQIDAGLIQDLVADDSFVDPVLLQSQGGLGVDPVTMSEARARFRENLRVVAEGHHLVVVAYRSNRAAEGIRLLTHLLTAVGETVPAIEFQTASRPGSGTIAGLRAAQEASSRSFRAMLKTRPLGARAPAPSVDRPPSPQTLRLQAEAASEQYRRKVAYGVQADPAALAALQPAAFQVLDKPAIGPSPHSRAISVFLAGLGGVMTIELLLVYLVTVIDSRIRTGLDAERRTGIRWVGSTGGAPVMRAP